MPERGATKHWPKPIERMHAAIFIPQFPIQAVLSASDLRRDTPIALLDAPAVSGKDKDIVQHILQPVRVEAEDTGRG